LRELFQQTAREQFRKCGIQYELSSKPTSDLYRDLLPLLNSRRVELLDDKKLIAQLTSLERRTARSGRDQISHPPGAHDDVANAVAGAFAAIAVPQQKLRMFTLECNGGPPSIELDARTGRPLDLSERTSVKWTTVLERDGFKFGHIRRWRSNWRIRPVRRYRGSER
jgi:hypothetical protein